MRYLIFLSSLFLITFTSCEKYLDAAPELEISDAEVFETYLSAQGYLDNCYQALNDYTSYTQQGNTFQHPACMSDEAANTNATSGDIKSILNGGDWYNQSKTTEIGWKEQDKRKTGTNTGLVIANAFFSIRTANKVLNNVPSMGSITQEEKNELLGQAYFLRSWYYFELIRRWGGMFIMDKAYAPDESIDIPRLSYLKSTEWLIEGLDEAIALLPDEWDEANLGRANKVAAMAVKSMAALYAASPLMQNDINATITHDYNQDWSILAAKYANDVLTYIDKNLPEKAMKGEGLSSDAQKNNYKHIFYHYPNFVSDESLWYLNSCGKGREADMAVYYMNIEFCNRSGNFGWTISTPSQNLVDMFEMNDGTPFDWNNPTHRANPYKNRDPRFYNNILYPGRQHGQINNIARYLETWDGGKDLSSTPAKTVPTGYMCIKWWWPEANIKKSPAYNNYYFNAIYIRTAQIWLDYAEAMNEAYGPNADPEGYGYTAVQAINKVRNRVGMADVKSEFTATEDIFRARIRNERAVELMWENHRWFDIRRWMIAEDVLGGNYPIKGIKAEVTNQNGTSNQELWDYSYSVNDVTTEVRVFENKHYWYPVAKDITDNTSVFKQNAGW